MSALTEEVALRIALAARELPDMEVRSLLLAIINLVGEPLTTAKMNKLRLGSLKKDSVLEDIDDSYLKAALGYLKGKGIEREPEPLPTVTAIETGSLSGSVLVACASNSGDKIDGHFGSCSRFLIYQLSSDILQLVDIRVPAAAPPDADKNALRAELINDCQILYTISIGGPAAAKVVRSGLHPIKLPEGGHAPEVLQRLQDVIASSPPPWLAKVMGVESEERVRFREGAAG